MKSFIKFIKYFFIQPLTGACGNAACGLHSRCTVGRNDPPLCVSYASNIQWKETFSVYFFVSSWHQRPYPLYPLYGLCWNQYACVDNPCFPSPWAHDHDPVHHIQIKFLHAQDIYNDAAYVILHAHAINNDDAHVNNNKNTLSSSFTQ